MEARSIEDVRETFKDFSSKLGDCRDGPHKLHSVEEILLLTLCALICGCEGWRDIERYGKIKLQFLRSFFPYKHGVPSDDTLRRFFRTLKPSQFQICFSEWSKNFSSAVKHIAIDGKVSRHTFDDEKNPLHMVSAFASECRAVLAQEKVSDKSNEITAIPKLLELLDVEGSVITIDAIGCQREIAQIIGDKKADYILSLKGNQSCLHEDVALVFQDKALLKDLEVSSYDTVDGSEHGRIEERFYRAVELPAELKKSHDWPYIKTIAEVTSRRTIKGVSTEEKRYYITSLENKAEVIGKAIRSHWSVENTLHWILDISFRDDDSRIRKGNAPQNIAIVKHMALNLLQKAKGKRDSIKQLRKASGWDDSQLVEVLQKIQ